ncbi:MAG: phage regulatory CII family protein [Alphaproteobacteria bacterium]
MTTDLTPSQLTLKAATRQLLEERAPLDALELETRVRRSQLSAYQSRNTGLFAPVDVVARLFELRREDAAERGDTSAPALLVELARAAGFGVVPLEPANGDQVLSCIAEWSSEVADVQAAIATALRDGTICAADASKIEREAMDMIADGKRLVASLRALVEGATLCVRDAPRRFA